MRLEEELHSYDSQLVNMLKKVKSMFILSKEALRDADKEKALSIIEIDDYINHIEEDINNHATQMLSLMQPVAKDLRQIIAGIKIATDIERIGDYAKSVGRFVIKSEPLDIEVVRLTEDIINVLIEQLDELITCLADVNLQLAYDIPIQDQKVDDSFITAIRYIEDKIHDENYDSHNYPLRLVNTLRSLERAGDHIKNVCESVIYRIKGQHIDFG